MRALLLLLAAGPLLAHPGWGMVVDRDGAVFVGDVIANAVWRISPSGAVTALAKGRHAHALCLDGAGELWGDHTDYDPATGRFSRSHWKLRDAEAVTILGGCPSLDSDSPAKHPHAARETGWDVYVALPEAGGGWLLLEHASRDIFEKRLKAKEAVTRVRRVDARGVSRILLLR